MLTTPGLIACALTQFQAVPDHREQYILFILYRINRFLEC